MNPICRRYQTEQDFWRMRDFLRTLFVVNQQRERSWHVARLDYARWHSCLNCAEVGLEEVAFLWEVEDQITAFLMPDGGLGEAHLCVHPHSRTVVLEEEMITVAEERLAEPVADGGRKLFIWSPQPDTLRQEILTRRGYSKSDWAEHQWRRQLDAAIPAAPLAPGFEVRSLGVGLELLERCYASGLGFHNGNIQVAVDNRTDPSWYRNIQRAPLYRRDLDLVVIGPEGEIAAFCTIWFDDVTRSAYFEPVATVPAHQRRGLGKAVMTEGLRRLQHIGATTAFVGGHSAAANALYQSVMGADHEVYEAWVKEWREG
jgi:mycothiol synthase